MQKLSSIIFSSLYNSSSYGWGRGVGVIGEWGLGVRVVGCLKGVGGLRV